MQTKPRDPAAHARSRGELRQRVIRARKGKGSFTRKGKHKGKAE